MKHLNRVFISKNDLFNDYITFYQRLLYKELPHSFLFDNKSFNQIKNLIDRLKELTVKVKLLFFFLLKPWHF